jgi:hypothetical protein
MRIKNQKIRNDCLPVRISRNFLLSSEKHRQYMKEWATKYGNQKFINLCHE